MRPVILAALIMLVVILSLFGGYFIGRDMALRDNAAAPAPAVDQPAD